MAAPTLFESPSGLIHMGQMMERPSRRAWTSCGTEVNLETWTHVSYLDPALPGRTSSSIRRLIDSACICERCFPKGG